MLLYADTPPNRAYALAKFQRAPTLGGECYAQLAGNAELAKQLFQRAPTLGGECYGIIN